MNRIKILLRKIFAVHRKRLFLSLVLVLLLFSCGKKEAEPIVELKEEEPVVRLIYEGRWMQGWTLGHNNKPQETDRFIVYTNYSEEKDVIATAEFAELVMDEVISHFEVEWDDYNFVSEQPNKKIVIFSDYNQRTSQGGVAYRDGIVIRALNSPLYTANYTFNSWRRTLKHELFHVNEFLLIGDPKYQQANTVWLREGMATYVSGRKTIVSINQLDSWQASQRNFTGGGNPIKINSFADLPSNDPNTVGAYYSFFELSARYLMDSKGNGSSVSDVKSFYSELGQGIPLDVAFANNFGLTLQQFQDQYWDLMREYLKE